MTFLPTGIGNFSMLSHGQSSHSLQPSYPLVETHDFIGQTRQ